MRRSHLVPGIALYGFALAACTATAPPPAAVASAVVAPEVELATPSRFGERTFTGAAGSRTYRLFVPTAHDGWAELPLLVMLHGCAQDAADIAAGTRMNQAAQERGLVMVYPEQPASANPQRCWNWYLPEHRARDGGEAALIAGITREVMRSHRIDARRVYVAGISAGGAMALVMAASYPDLYAAVASHSGVMFGAASDVAGALAAMQGQGLDPESGAAAVIDAMGSARRPVPALVIHGAADPLVNPDNAAATADQWVRAHRGIGVSTRSEPESEEIERNGRRATRFTYRDAEGGVVVERWSIPGLAHAWSGGAAAGSFTDPDGFDATREIVRFFLDHPRR
jgi:poly(hydroxyalkanoate) depolymerase family esterase